MPKYEVDVRKVDFGYVSVTADNPADAIEKVKRGYFKAKEFWTSIEIQPLCARPKGFQQEIDSTLSKI